MINNPKAKGCEHQSNLKAGLEAERNRGEAIF